ncbi:MAG: hypothetical protein N2558_04255 [Patescibacteria group bacterium]|nr:hypothetical protein [Patescibacteria group bacterium]
MPERIIDNNKFISRIAPYLGGTKNAQSFVGLLLENSPSLTKHQIFEIVIKNKGKPKSPK